MVFILKACFTISSDDHSSKVADCGTTTITCNSSSKAFSWDEITKASKNFSKVIGSGGFSTVYLARLAGVLTAVKIQSSCTDRLARIHDQELQILLTLQHHPNIVNFLGHSSCDNQQEHALLFEYVSNGIKERCPQGIPTPKAKARMTSPTRGGDPEGRDDREGTPPLTKEQIEGHISAMKSIIKEHNKRNKANPIRLNFETEDQDPKEDRIVKGREVDDDDLSKPFKETLKTPFTRRIIEFSGPEYSMPTNIALYDGSTDPADHLNRFVGAANSGEWPMPVWCRMFQQTLDGSARGWFENLPPNSIDEWWRLREAFTTSSTRKACYKEPHEITKIVRKANETLTAFKERWTVETGFIMGVPEVMKISSFMDSVKSPELAKRFASSVPKTVDEMMKRLDEFVRAEEAYALTELPPGESRDIHRRLSFPASPRDVHQRLTFPSARRDDRDGRNNPGRDSEGDLVHILTRAMDKPSIGKTEKITDPAGLCGRRVISGSHVRALLREPSGRRQRARPGKLELILGVLQESESKPLGKIDWKPKDTTMHPLNKPYSMIKFPTPKGIATLIARTITIAECRKREEKQMIREETPQEEEGVDATEQVVVNPSFPDQMVTIGGRLSKGCREQLKTLLKNNIEVFAWEPADMTGVPRKVIEHTLNVNPSLDPVCQKKRTFSPEKSGAVTKEVTDWVKAGIVRPVKYPTYISNPVLVKKCDGSWRMCIDFKNRTHMPKDYYPLPNIDSKSSGHGVSEKRGLLADIAETFEGLKTINMKLNPKKCSFGVEEGKFLGYMVTSEGIRANPKKTKAISDLQSPKTLKEMQSLSGKLASLNRFLAKSAERALPFFNTLKNITKENKHEYRWTARRTRRFSRCRDNQCAIHRLTPPYPEETLYAYLAVSREAVSAVLLTDRNGRQCPVQYVSRTLNEAERNYSPLEKLALSLVNMTRRLRRYFEAHPVKEHTRSPSYHGECSKGQVQADFLSDAPDGEREDEYFQSPEVPPEIDDTEAWTLYTDGAASSKGSGAGLVLTGPSGVEYAYALRVKTFSIENIPRGSNQKADVLSKLATVPFHNLTKEILVEVLNERSTEVGPEISNTLTDTQDSQKQSMTLHHAPWPSSVGMDILGKAAGQDNGQGNNPLRDGQYHMQIWSPKNHCHGQWGTTDKRPLQDLMEGIKTRLGREKAGWVDELPNVLWAHRTSIKQSNGETPFSLTYGSEAVIPAEIGMPSYRTLMIREEFNEEEQRLNLDLLQERREAAAIREARYKSKMEQYYNKKVRPAGFRPGEFVYRRNEASRVEDQGKLGPKWEGPYRVTEAFENGSYKLQTMEDKVVPRTWHAINLRKCYL
ncbi:reverse transcriptase domain-containing protein [Tanacetum coccineum]